MKQVTCKNCGAVFNETLDKCPYCGTMNKKGSYRSFRLKIFDLIDRMLGLKDEAYKSLSKGILLSLLRGFAMVALIILAAFIVSRFYNVNPYDDKEYDQETLETILWEDENLDKLEEAYRNEDFATIEKLYYENSSVVSSWAHYPDYALKKQFSKIDGKPIDAYVLRDILYFLFYPEYYTGYDGMKGVNTEDYELMKQSIFTACNQIGLSKAKLEEIYRNHCDTYGYISASDLSQYVKEGGNG